MKFIGREKRDKNVERSNGVKGLCFSGYQWKKKSWKDIPFQTNII